MGDHVGQAQPPADVRPVSRPAGLAPDEVLVALHEHLDALDPEKRKAVEFSITQAHEAKRARLAGRQLG